jgi:hypothetical protein
MSTHPSWTYPEGYNLTSFDQMLEQDPEPYGPDPASRVLEDETGAELTPEEFDEALYLHEQQIEREAMDEAMLYEQIESMFDWVVIGFALVPRENALQFQFARGMTA